MEKTMNALLLLVAVFGSVAADFRPECTVEQMRGLNVVGYAYDRVFRLPDYQHKIQLDDKFILKKGIVKSISNVMRMDLTRLVHLHQGFGHKLIVLEYGASKIQKTDAPDVTKLKDLVFYHNETDIAVINSATVDRNVGDRIDSYDSGWSRARFGTKHPTEKDFGSFIYDDLLHYQGGYTNISNLDFEFVRNSRDLCVGMKFPVVDIAYKPPICHNRVLNESAPTPSDPDDDDEWIVALVKGIRTTRSEKLYRQSKDPGETFVRYDEGSLILPNHDVFSYYMLKPGMNKPCMFAQGSKYIFHDVQVEPADPILPFATGLPSSTIMPPITDSGTKNAVEGTDVKNTSETQAPSWLFCFGFVFSGLAASM